MITPKILYAQMKKWVLKDDTRPAMQCIYFDGEKAYATNSNHLAIVKSYPVKEAHYETPEGCVETKGMPEEPIKYEGVIVKENDILWKYEVNFGPIIFKNRALRRPPAEGFIACWKTAFDFLAKVSKKREYKGIFLQKTGTQLLAYAVAPAENEKWLKAKIVLIDHLDDDGHDWKMGFNSEYLLNVVDFLKTTEPQKLEIHVNKAMSILTVETEDLLMLTAGVRDPGLDLATFMESESKDENKAEETDEDTDFLG